MRVSLCCIARLETLTIKDWVEYHKKKGIYHIYIYDNNDIGDNSLNEILKEYIHDGFVTIMNIFKGKTSCQIFSYNHFLGTHCGKDEYDWIGFIDCDEYLDFTTKELDTPNKLFSYYENNCPLAHIIYINWEMYGDNHQYFFDGTKTVTERFPLPIANETQKESVHIKSFIKKDTMASFSWNPHMALGQGKFCIMSSDGLIVPKPTPWIQPYYYRFVKLKHYVTKSLEEYIFRKFNNKCGDNENEFHYTMDYYWKYNDKTQEALDALEKLKTKYKIP